MCYIYCALQKIEIIKDWNNGVPPQPRNLHLFLLLIVSSVSGICKAPTPAFLHLMGFFLEMQETAVEGLALRFL